MIYSPIPANALLPMSCDSGQENQPLWRSDLRDIRNFCTDQNSGV